MKNNNSAAAAVTESIMNAITWKHTGKMKGMISLSTSVLLNKYCQERQKNPDSVCSHCYAQHMAGKLYKGLKEKLAKNTDLLTREVIPVEWWPILNTLFFRLEAFGDLNNVIQLQNYFNFAKRNPYTTFTLWTKNTFILFQAEKAGAQKPKNIIIIESSPFVNVQVKKTHKWVDKTFTVLDKSHKDDKRINCGARHCLTCLKCYKKRTTSEIFELLK